MLNKTNLYARYKSKNKKHKKGKMKNDQKLTLKTI